MKSLFQSVNLKHEPELYLGPRLFEGVPVGSVVGVSGDGGREWILEFIKMNENCDAAWLEDVMDVLPTALKSRNLNLDRISFLESNENWNQALGHVLRSDHFDLIVLPLEWVNDLKDRKAWSRFLGWVKGTGITVFLVSEYPEKSASVPMQIHTWFKEKRMVASRLR
ncbi:MAG: hypothetical protein KA715_13045 [Xanthomonadaceae bacterium]|nr:hypothetical protein [Xanthomonadaceae bacterium]